MTVVLNIRGIGSRFRKGGSKEKSGRARRLLSRLSDTEVERQSHSTHRVSYQNAQVLDGMFTVPLFAHALFVDPDVVVHPASGKSRQQA